MPRLCVYHDKLGYEHAINSYLRCSSTDVRGLCVCFVPLFCMRFQDMRYSFNIEKVMEDKDIIEIVSRMQKQDVSEITATLRTLENELGIKVNEEVLDTGEDSTLFGYIPLSNIYSVHVSNTHVIILCRNGVVHCYDRRIKSHSVFLPQLKKPGIGEVLWALIKKGVCGWKRFF